MIKGILWDNDGVLVDTERFFYEVNRDLLAGLGVELTEQHFLDWYLRDNCGAWHLVDGATPEKINVWRAERNRLYSARLHSERVAPMDGISEVLQALGHLKMGVVTSANAEHFDIIHAGLDLRRHFDFVLTHESYSNSKPSPEPYLLGLERLGLPADEVIVIEDSPRGLQAATAAGLRCVILRHTLTASHNFTGAWRTINTPKELLQLGSGLTFGQIGT